MTDYEIHCISLPVLNEQDSFFIYSNNLNVVVYDMAVAINATTRNRESIQQDIKVTLASFSTQVVYSPLIFLMIFTDNKSGSIPALLPETTEQGSRITVANIP